MVAQSIENKLKQLTALEYSKSNVQLALNISLDIKNEVDKLKEDMYTTNFIRNWEISIDNFAGLTLDDEELPDTASFFQDAIEEMAFDVNGLLRHLK